MKSRERSSYSRGVVLIGITLLILVISLRLVDPTLLQTARLSVFDTYQQLSPRPYEAAPVRVIDLDDRSLAVLGQWPWPRTVMARIVDRLAQLGAAAICFDIVFAETDRTSPGQILGSLPKALSPELSQQLQALPDHDQVFMERIAQAPVVLGFAGSDKQQPEKPRLLAGMAHAGSDPRELLKVFPGAVGNLPLFEQAASGQGSFALGDTEGGLVRRIPLLLNIDNILYPSFSVEALRVAQGASTIITRASDASGEVNIGDIVDLQTVRVGALEIPVTADGHIWMHYTGPVPERSLSAIDLLDKPPEQLIELIEGQIILIGTSAAGLKDLRSTPLAAFEPGVTIHAQALEQMLLGWYLERPGWAKGAEILALGLMGVFLILLLPRLGALWSAVLGLMAIAMGVLASWIAFTEYRLLIDPVYPALAASMVYVVTSSFGYLRAEQDKRQLRDAFRSFLAPALVDQLADSPERLRLGGESREMTFLFTDIAGFTSFTEASTPEHLVNLLNLYLDRMCAIVMDHGGTIDKIVGDAIHAIFNAPLDQPDHAARAVACALALDREGQTFVAAHSTPGLAFGETRIGVNTGPAIVGNFGGRRRFDYTAHGDAINTAARLESVNKHLGTRVCIAESAAGQCPEQHFRPIAELVLKGKTQGVATYIPVSQADTEKPLYKDYQAFYQRLRNQEADLLPVARQLARDYPDDPLIKLHLKRLEKGESGVLMVLDQK